MFVRSISSTLDQKNGYNDPISITSNSDFFGMQWYLMNLSLVFVASNPLILLVNEATQPEMILITKHKWGSTSKCSRTQSRLHDSVCGCFALILKLTAPYSGEDPGPDTIDVRKILCSCAWCGVDCLGFSHTLPRPQQYFQFVLHFDDV